MDVVEPALQMAEFLWEAGGAVADVAGAAAEVGGEALKAVGSVLECLPDLDL